MKKQGTNSTEIKIPEPKEYVLNGKKFSYHLISYENFHKFAEAFSSTMKPEADSPLLIVKCLFSSNAALDIIQLILLDEELNPPTIEFLKSVSPLHTLGILTDFFDSEGYLLLTGIFALVKSMK